MKGHSLVSMSSPIKELGYLYVVHNLYQKNELQKKKKKPTEEMKSKTEVGSLLSSTETLWIEMLPNQSRVRASHSQK